MIFNSEFLVTLLLLNVCLTYAVYPMAIIGRTSLAPVAFMAIGAYSASYAVERGWSIWFGALIGLVINLLLSTVFNGVLSRLRGHFFVAASLGLVFIVQQLAFILVEFTNGYRGVSQPAGLIDPNLVWVLFAVCAIGAFSLEKSFQNSVWRSVGDNDVIASAIGVSVRKQVMVAGWLSALIATVVGVIYSNAIAFFDPNTFGFTLLLYLIIAVVAGGSSAWYGPIIGGIVMTLLPDLLRSFGPLRETVLGIVLALCAIFLPRGLSDQVTLGRWFRKLFRRRTAADQNPDEDLRPPEAPNARESHPTQSTDSSSSPLRPAAIPPRSEN